MRKRRGAIRPAFGSFVWIGWAVVAVAGVEGREPMENTSSTASFSHLPAFGQDQATCSSLCPRYQSLAAAAQSLNVLAENFWILWNLIARDPDSGSAELTARSTAPHKNSDGKKDNRSLQALVQQWAESRFGSQGSQELMERSGPSFSPLPPAFRDSSHSSVGVMDAACPYGDLGLLGNAQCPACTEQSSEMPESLIPCVRAYSKKGDMVKGSTLPFNGLYRREMQSNFCGAEMLFQQAAAWKVAVAPEVSGHAEGSLAALKMFQNALEGNTPDQEIDRSAETEKQLSNWSLYFGGHAESIPDEIRANWDSCWNRVEGLDQPLFQRGSQSGLELKKRGE